VLVDQFVDRTHARAKSFFGDGIVAHVSMAHPTCACLTDRVEAAIKETGVSYRRGGTYLAMEGPQFSSQAESKLYRSWGMDVIGMTNMPEAKLAREAELRYVSIAMVTDFDCWHPDHDHVDVAMVVETLHRNADHARNVVKALARAGIASPTNCARACDKVLDGAIITARDKWTKSDRLDAVAGRVLKIG